MKKTKFRILAALLTVCMLLTLLPADGLAAEQTPVTYTRVDSSVLPDDAVRESETPPSLEDEDVPSDDELVRAIVLLEEASILDSGFSTTGLAQNTAAMAYKARLLSQQDAMIRRIESRVLGGGALDVRRQFTIGVNAIAVRVPYGRIAAMEKLDGVQEIILEEPCDPEDPLEPNTSTSGEMVNFYSVWANGYTGAGSVIAIVDTGIDRDHPSFTEEGYYYGMATSAAKLGKTISDYDLLTVEDVAAVLPQLHAYLDYEGTLTAEDLYTSAKIPFGYNYLMNSASYDCDSLSGDHGCHVAGIAAANTYVPTLDGEGDPCYATQEQGVTGVAPNAQLLVMKVFSDGWGAYPADYMAAIEDAIMLGADSVNLSLGSGSAGRTFDNSMAQLLAALMASDTVMTNSAGNSGGWADYEIGGVGLNRTEDVRTNTGGSPGSYNESFTIASVDNIAITGIVGNYNGFIAAVNDTGDGYGANLFPSLDTSADGSGTEYPYVFLGDPETGSGIYGLAEDFEGLDLTGKIVLISRGNSSFFEKANLAVEHGAAATVIYNNVDGSINMNLTGYLYPNPAVSMAKADSDAIFAVSTKNEQTGLWEGTVTVSSRAQTVYGDREHPVMSSFSSWGCGDKLNLKPELTSPGGNIYSTLDGGTYGLNSGTSMSAPSATGSAAVIAQYIKENNLAQKTGLSVRELAIALMMSTASPITHKETGLPYSPRQQGAGLTQIYEAVTSPAYLLAGKTEGNDGKVKLELGDDPNRTGVYVGTFSVNNMTDRELLYSFDSTIFTSAVETYEGVNYMSKSGYGLCPAVSFTTEAAGTYIYDLNGDDAVDALDALALLKVANSTAPALSEADANLYDFDDDGAITTTDAQLLLAALKGDANDLDTNAETYVVPANGSIQVNFTITLSEKDKEFFQTWYPNGGYIDGFLYVNSENGDDRQLSIPLLAFYGNWSDSSMFEHWNLLEDENNPDAVSYVASNQAMNYFTIKYRGSSTEYIYTANNYATDDSYLADRNAINNRSTLYRVFPTLLRNAANLTVTIRNAETGEEYFSKSLGMGTGAYYYINGATWSALGSGSSLEWKVTDQEGERLEEGTQVEVEVRAVTEYNWEPTWDEENGQWNYTTGAVRGTLGEGAYWRTTMTVDNTAPEATSIAVTSDAVTGQRSVKVTALDNRYTAAVLLLSTDGAVLGRYAVNQTEPNREASVDIDLTQIYTNDFIIGVYDYAGNANAYEVHIGGQIRIPDTNTILSAAMPNNEGQWFAELDVDAQTVTYQNSTAGQTPILSMARAADGTLYAASQEVVDNYLVSALYTVNASDWSMTAIGGLQELGYTDMSWAPTTNGGSLMAVYGNYAMVVDTATGAYLGAWDLTSYLGSATAVALTFVQTQADSTYGLYDLFLMMDSNGVVYQTGFAYDASTGKYTIFKPAALLQVPNVYNTFYGSSMYCENGVVFISALSAQGETLYSQLYNVDLTASNLWLFDRGTIGTAPICIYDATAKEAVENPQNLKGLLPMGQPIEAERHLEINLCPMRQDG